MRLKKTLLLPSVIMKIKYSQAYGQKIEYRADLSLALMKKVWATIGSVGGKIRSPALLLAQ